MNIIKNGILTTENETIVLKDVVSMSMKDGSAISAIGYTVISMVGALIVLVMVDTMWQFWVGVFVIVSISAYLSRNNYRLQIVTSNGTHTIKGNPKELGKLREMIEASLAES